MTSLRKSQPRVVIVGGSFAGLAACRHLKDYADVTLIEPKEYFEYTPGILHLLTGSLSNNIILSPLNQVSGNAKIINGFFQGLQIKDREVIVKPICNNYENKKENNNSNNNNDLNPDSVMKVPYDYVIIATGRPYTSPIRPPSSISTSNP